MCPGLDPNQLAEIRNLIIEIGKEKTVMLSTHIMQEVEAICDRVIIIDRGVIVADEAKSDIYSKISRSRQTVLVEFDRDPEEAMLRAIPGAGSVKKAKDRVWIIESQGEEASPFLKGRWTLNIYFKNPVLKELLHLEYRVK